MFKILDVKIWRWHKAKCFVQQLFDVGYMAVVHKPQHINSRTAAGPYASIKRWKIFSQLTFPMCAGLAEVQQLVFHHTLCGESDFTVKLRLCLA